MPVTPIRAQAAALVSASISDPIGGKRKAASRHASPAGDYARNIVSMPCCRPRPALLEVPVKGTGYPVSDRGSHVGTFQLPLYAELLQNAISSLVVIVRNSISMALIEAPLSTSARKKAVVRRRPTLERRDAPWLHSENRQPPPPLYPSAAIAESIFTHGAEVRCQNGPFLGRVLINIAISPPYRT